MEKFKNLFLRVCLLVALVVLPSEVMYAQKVQPRQRTAVTQKSAKVYDVVEEPPSFPGGAGAMLSWLQNNVKYPTEAVKNKIQGRVVVQFIVEKDGSVSGVTVVRSVDPLLDREAARVVGSMPKWTPGKQKGQPVRVKYTVPVVFKM